MDALTTSFNTVIAALGGCGDITINIDKPPGAVALDFDLTIEMYNSATQFISATTPVSIV